MNTFRKTLTAVALGAAVSVSWMVGSSLVRDVQFARAQERVDASRAQIASVQDLSTVFNAVGKTVEPSVVNIDVVKNVPIPQGLGRFFGGRGRFIPPQNPNDNGNNDQNSPDQQQLPPQFQEQGTGSGVIMEADGDTAYIVTNNHVAGGAGEMKITLSDGRVIKDAKLVGADPKSDLAVVKINVDHVIPAKWGDSDKLEQGDFILAFGSPFHYVGSMTHGIVSATHRNSVGIISSDFAYENFIQVDAPINPGNSGGPLVNLHGEVVGINTAIATESGAFSGLGFAIPSNQVKAVYTSLKTSGKVVRGWLGVQIGDVADAHAQAAQLGYEGKDGILVGKTFKDTPAFNKLEPGDVITELSGKKVRNTQELRNQIAATAPGTEVTLKVFRDGKQQDVSIKLGEQPEELSAVASAQNGSTSRRPGNNGNGTVSALSPEALGMQLNTASPELLQRFSLDSGVKGAVVTGVTRGSLAYQAQLQAGDVITRINGTPVTSADEAADALSKADLKKGIQLRVSDRQSERSVFIQSDEPLPQR